MTKGKTLMLTFCTMMSLSLTQIIFHQAILMGVLKISRKIHPALHINIRSLLTTLKSAFHIDKSLFYLLQ